MVHNQHREIKMKGKAKVPSLTHQQVRDALDYNPATGVFVWKISPAKNVKSGTTAGGNSKGNGYRYIRLSGEEITECRMAWFYMTGRWPERRVRFKNGDKSDCRFENLTLFNGLVGEFDHKTREGRQAYQNAYRAKTPNQQKARALRDSFGLSLDEYNRMFEAQQGKCAICNQPETQMRKGKLKTLAVDHNHKSGAIRGLLCFDCNTGIGKLKDDPQILRLAAQYLEFHLGIQTIRPA
jgi:hypothetical protein